MLVKRTSPHMGGEAGGNAKFIFTSANILPRSKVPNMESMLVYRSSCSSATEVSISDIYEIAVY